MKSTVLILLVAVSGLGFQDLKEEPASLRLARSVHERSVARFQTRLEGEMRRANKRYANVLDDLVKKETKAGNLQAALAVQAELQIVNAASAKKELRGWKGHAGDWLGYWSPLVRKFNGKSHQPARGKALQIEISERGAVLKDKKFQGQLYRNGGDVLVRWQDPNHRQVRITVADDRLFAEYFSPGSYPEAFPHIIAMCEKKAE